jgi:hypothetical protein
MSMSTPLAALKRAKYPTIDDQLRAGREAEHNPRLIPMCYMTSWPHRIEWGLVAKIEGRGPKAVARFHDGNWCHAQDCFLTEAQCLRYHKVPPRKDADKLDKIANLLERVVATIRSK